MCERNCPACNSSDHSTFYGLGGTGILCTSCGLVLAIRADIATAPLDLTEPEAERWQEERSGVMVGAEASDPSDDVMFGPNRWPLAEEAVSSK